MVTGLSPFRVTHVIDAISYMVNFRSLLMWLDPFILLGLRLRLRVPLQGTHPHFHLKRSFLCPINTRIISTLLKQANLPLLLLLPRSIMPMPMPLSKAGNSGKLGLNQVEPNLARFFFFVSQ